MQTVNEAAKNNCKNEVKEGEKTDALFSSREGMQQLVERTFKSGVEFAQRWIPVVEELPLLRLPVLVKMSYSFFNTDIPATDCCYWNGKSWINAIRQHHSNGSVTHWRPIEYPIL